MLQKHWISVSETVLPVIRTSPEIRKKACICLPHRNNNDNNACYEERNSKDVDDSLNVDTKSSIVSEKTTCNTKAKQFCHQPLEHVQNGKAAAEKTNDFQAVNPSNTNILEFR